MLVFAAANWCLISVVQHAGWWCIMIWAFVIPKLTKISYISSVMKWEALGLWLVSFSFPAADLFPRYRAGFWHDWVWGVGVGPVGLQGVSVPECFNFWVWAHAHYTHYDTPVHPTLRTLSTSHSGGSGAAWGGEERGAGSVKLSTAQAD